jgi:hypothetical protein
MPSMTLRREYRGGRPSLLGPGNIGLISFHSFSVKSLGYGSIVFIPSLIYNRHK